MAIKVKLVPGAVARLLKSKEVLADLEARGQRIAAAAGDGYEAEASIGSARARVTVRTATPDAMVTEARDHTLLRSLDAGRHA